MSSTSYNFIPRVYHSANGQWDFDVSSDTTNIQAVYTPTHTIFVQRIIVWITTSAAEGITFQDETGFEIAAVDTSPGANTRWDFDFGERGVSLTAGSDLQAVFSDPGLAGHMEWYGYQVPA